MGTRKLGRKIVSLLMVMVLSFEMVAWAAPAQIHNQELFVVQYEKLKMDGIEQFFQKI